MLGDEPDGLPRAVELLQPAVEPLRPEGRPLFAGLRSLGLPGDAAGRRLAAGRPAPRVPGRLATPRRGRRAGFDATEIGLLSELYWGLPMRTYVRTRAWSRDDLDAAEERLDVARPASPTAASPTRAGRRASEVERATDAACRPIVDALGDDLDELVAILEPWGAAIRDAAGYPAGGPHDLARAASGG